LPEVLLAHHHGDIDGLAPSGAVHRRFACREATLAAPRVGRLVQRLLLFALVLPALWHLYQLFRVFRAQVSFPMDLEWMEGGELYHAWRLVHGDPVYGPPSQGFVPYPYPPLHFVMLALVAKVAGFGYTPARLLSVACFAIGAVALGREVVLGAEDKWQGRAGALLAMGAIAASVPAVSGWYALIRNDSLAIALPVVAAALACEGEPSRARAAALAGALTASVYAKQTGVFFVAVILTHSIVRNRRAGIQVLIATLTLSGMVLVALELATQGWFFRYIMAPRHHAIISERVPMGTWAMLHSAPFLIVIPFVAAFLLGRRALTSRTLLWVAMLLAAFPASLLPYAKAGGCSNDWIPVLFLAGPTAVLLAFDASRLFRKSGGHAEMARLSLGALFAVLLWWGRYDARPFMPTEELRSGAAQLNAWVASLPGEVLTLSHPMLALGNGKRTEQLHAMGLTDAETGGISGFAVSEMLERTAPDFVVVDQDAMNTGAWEAILRFYEPDRKVPHRVPMTIATQVSPAALYRKKPELRSMRRVFDFETGYAGWALSGSAFAEGPTVDKRRCQGTIVGVEGKRLANSYTCGEYDRAMGRATSPSFVLDRSRLGLLVGGGRQSRERVELRVGGTTVRTATGNRSETLHWVEWDVSAYEGEPAELAIIDEDTDAWGHLLVDDVELFDRAE
jgi:hypothetical protein